MEVFKGIFDFFKKEIELNKEYYRSLSAEEADTAPQEIMEPPQILEQPQTTAKTQPITQFDPHTKVRTDTYTIYYENGRVVKLIPTPNSNTPYYDVGAIVDKAISIVSDGIPYDLSDKQSIYSIRIPNYSVSPKTKFDWDLGVTGVLDYVLRKHSGLCWRKGEFDISIACLEKATELMKYSSVGWPPKDFFRIVNELNDLGQFKKAQRWKEWIERNIPGAISAAFPSAEEQMSGATRDSFNTRIKSCKELGTDLVEIGEDSACCSKCAMYRKRVYSLYGKDKRFPKFPKDYHWGCGMIGWPYVYGVSEPSFPCSDIIGYSNRPFVDDRTEEEIENYKNRLQTLNGRPEVIRAPNLTRIIYYRLVKLLPADAPKSLSGFSRMRNANSKNYQALVKKAEAAGFVFPETLEDVAKRPENQ